MIVTDLILYPGVVALAQTALCLPISFCLFFFLKNRVFSAGAGTICAIGGAFVWKNFSPESILYFSARFRMPVLALRRHIQSRSLDHEIFGDVFWPALEVLLVPFVVSYLCLYLLSSKKKSGSKTTPAEEYMISGHL